MPLPTLGVGTVVPEEESLWPDGGGRAISPRIDDALPEGDREGVWERKVLFRTPACAGETGGL
jgi:hypothetical protein